MGDARISDYKRRGQQQRLSRLLQLLLLLKSNRFPSSQSLADRCGVNRRTIFRDFELLEEAGFAIDYHPDRFGYSLLGDSTPMDPLSENEVASLVFMAQCWGGADGLGLIRQAREGLVKVVAGLKPEAQTRVQGLIEPLSGHVLERPAARRPIYDGLLDSLMRRVQVRLRYRNPRDLNVEATKVSPYRLLLAQPMWCLIGQSSFHRRVSLFKVPYILELHPTNDSFLLPPRFDMSRYLAGAWLGEPETAPQDIWLRFSPLVAPEIRDVVWHPSQQVAELADGRVDLRFSTNGIDDLARWVLGYGDQVEILSPQTLRRRVREIAHRVWRRHGPLGITNGLQEDDKEPSGPTIPLI